ncbi:MAG: bifunctional phosphopantothenoylcysteine decarboxylase/phosphopantothenate--cysteine ligase CoaBC [Pseudomonadota bacterium]
MRPESKILFMMSGSIACAKATGLISAWTKEGHTVRVAATASVVHFVGRATLEGLSGQPVFDDTFEAGHAMDHIALAQWADVIVVCPASASLLARLANGIADDAVSTLWQASWGRGARHFVVPSMNTHMWDYPATRENVARLRRWGIEVLETDEGLLACGESGAGRMPEVEEVKAVIERALAGASGFGAADADGPQALRVLVTGGGTREPIDAVRYIGNQSTGRTSATLASHLAQAGHAVTWLGGAGAAKPKSGVQQARFVTFDDLADQLEHLLGNKDFDLVIHAAAVSDFSVQADRGAGERKLASGAPLQLNLKPNPKLLNRLKDWSCNPALAVVGFKLTVGADDRARDAAVDRLFAGGACDLVVHNDYASIKAGNHPFTVLDREGARRSVEGTDALASALVQELTERGRASS